MYSVVVREDVQMKETQATQSIVKYCLRKEATEMTAVSPGYGELGVEAPTQRSNWEVIGHEIPTMKPSDGGNATRCKGVTEAESEVGRDA